MPCFLRLATASWSTKTPLRRLALSDIMGLVSIFTVKMASSVALQNVESELKIFLHCRPAFPSSFPGNLQALKDLHRLLNISERLIDKLGIVAPSYARKEDQGRYENVLTVEHYEVTLGYTLEKFGRPPDAIRRSFSALELSLRTSQRTRPVRIPNEDPMQKHHS